MKIWQKLRPSLWTLTIIVLLLFGVISSVAILYPCWPCTEVKAALVQAILSFMAIGIAICVPAQQHRNDLARAKDERLRRQIVLATPLRKAMAHFSFFAAEIGGWQKVVDRGSGPLLIEDSKHMKDSLIHIGERLKKGIKIIEQWQSELWVFEAIIIRKIGTCIEQVEELIPIMDSYSSVGDGFSDYDKKHADAQKMIYLLKDICERASGIDWLLCEALHHNPVSERT